MHRVVRAHFPALSSKTLEVVAGGEEEGGTEGETTASKVIRVWPNHGGCGITLTTSLTSHLLPSSSLCTFFSLPPSPFNLSHNFQSLSYHSQVLLTRGMRDVLEGKINTVNSLSTKRTAMQLILSTI